MTTNLATILATKIRTALEVDHSTDDAHALATIGVLVQQAGLSLTPLPEQEQPRASSEAQRHPSGVEVTVDSWLVHVDGEWAGLIARRDAGHVAYFTDGKATLDSLDAAVNLLVAQHRTPSPDALAQAHPGLAEAAEAGLALTISSERSIERGRDDAEEDSRREAEAVQ